MRRYTQDSAGPRWRIDRALLEGWREPSGNEGAILSEAAEPYILQAMTEHTLAAMSYAGTLALRAERHVQDVRASAACFLPLDPQAGSVIALVRP